MTPERRERLGLLTRAAIGLGLLGLLVWNVGPRNLFSTLASPRWGFLAVSIAFSALLIGVSCLKWQLLLRARGVSVGFGRLFGLYLIGMLFNNFLPSNFGGDVVRSIGLGRYTRQMSNSLATVFMERLTGFVALVACAWVGFAVHGALLDESALLVALVAATVALAAVLWAIVDPRPIEWARDRLPGRRLRRVVDRTRPILDAVRGFRDSRLLAVAMALSLVFYAFAVLNVYFSARVFGGPPDLAGLAGVVPIVLVAAMLPITVGGIGLSEWAYVVCLGQIGVPPQEALAVGLVLRFKIVGLSLIGGLVTIGMRHEPPVSR